MSLLVIPRVGRGDSLAYFVNQRAPENIVLRLYQSNLTPAETDEAEQYNEATWTGYAPIELLGDQWALADAVGSYERQVFTSAAGNQNQLVFGYYATRKDSGRLVLAERFPGRSYLIANLGDTIGVSLEIAQEAKAMWAVNDEGQVGVINGMSGTRAEFHRIGAEGLTELVALVEHTTLTKAKWRDIPEKRRPPRARAQAFGYL